MPDAKYYLGTSTVCRVGSVECQVSSGEYQVGSIEWGVRCEEANTTKAHTVPMDIANT